MEARLEELRDTDELEEIGRLNARLFRISLNQFKRTLIGAWRFIDYRELNSNFLRSCIELGHFPSWIEKTTGTKLKEVKIGGEAPTGYVWDILTGELSFNPFKIGCFN